MGLVVGVVLNVCLAGGCGWSLARASGARPRWAAASLYAHLAVFWTLLGLELLGVRISTLSCGVVLALIGAAAKPFWVPETDQLEKELATWHMPWVIWAALASMTSLMVVIALRFPLAGFDAGWRWEELGKQIAARGTFSFYPPRSAEDYRVYFYTDGFAPLVPSVYAYLYLGAGRAAPALTALPVVLQWVGTLAFTASAARTLSPTARWMAPMLLAGSSLLFLSTSMGQETGLTAFATAGFFAAVMSPHARPLAMGLSLATLALCRDYAPGLALAGVVAAWILRPDSRKKVAIATGVAAAIALPWNLRNWDLTGNPVYSQPLLSFTVNDIHARIMRHCYIELSPTTWSGRLILLRLRNLLVGCGGVSVLLGIAALLRREPGGTRQRLGFGVLLAATALTFYASIGYTAGGADYAMRVMTPAIVAGVLWVCVSALWLWSGWRRPLTAVVMVVFFAYGAYRVVKLTSTGSSRMDMTIASETLKQTKAGERILSDAAGFFLVMRDNGRDVVPVWSPEVAFLASPGTSGDEGAAELRKRGIRWVMLQRVTEREAAFSRGLNGIPFYDTVQTWEPAARVGVEALWRVPD